MSLHWVHDEPELRSEARPLALVGIALTGILAGAVFGALTNAINGAVSPTYFVNILGWHDVEDVWRASIAQGVFEGLVFGTLFALVFTTGVGIITRGTCTYGFALRYLLGILAAAYLCWALGGLLAMGLAALSPEFYRRAFIGVPEEFGAMLRYAWVGGSILGAQLGGLVCVILGLVIVRAKWRRASG
ncbi:MAG: hypothetical protein L0Z62_36590 [Gemmataceae bacterium]|nr:hypothetical protein [Gemmataceae bacterium]